MADPVQRRAQVPGTGPVRVTWIARENLEDATADDLLADGHRVAQVSVADRDEHQFRVQHPIGNRHGLKQRLIIPPRTTSQYHTMNYISY